MEFNARIEISGPLFNQGPAIVQQNVDAFVTETTAFLLREVQLRTPQGVNGAQGGLLGSIQQEVIGVGTPAVRGIVATASPYGQIIERGRRPGKMPPPGVLREWIEVKFGVSGRDLNRLEFLVRRKIGQKGFEGKAMFSKALLENQATIETMAQARGLALAVELRQ